MRDGHRSQTAQGSAEHRAAHQLFDHPKVFVDRLALTVIGPEAERRIRGASHLQRPSMIRAFVVGRSRYAEDCLGEAAAGGVRQYLVLGAGLDTFAYRNRDPELTVFEVDHPATQDWKRARLRLAGVSIPNSVVYCPIIFGEQPLEQCLRQTHFQFAKPVFISWLGVTIYLESAAVEAVLSDIAHIFPGGVEIVFDYSTTNLDDESGSQAGYRAMALRARRFGEPYRSTFTPEGLAGRLHQVGFEVIEDLDMNTLDVRHLGHGRGAPGGGRIVRARK